MSVGRSDVVFGMQLDNTELKEALRDSQNSFRDFGDRVTSIVGAVGATLLVQRIRALGGEFFDLYQQQERSERRLAGALTSTGNAAGFTVEQLVAYSSQLQVITGLQDRVINEVMAIAANFDNVRGESFLEVTELAIDMATVLQRDVRTTVLSLGKALNEPISGLEALTRSISGFSAVQRDVIRLFTETGRLAEAQALILGEVRERFAGAAEEVAKSTMFWTRFKNELINVGEILGKGYSQILEFLSKNFLVLISAVKAVMPVMKELISQFKDFLQPAVQKTRDIITSFAENAIIAFVTLVESIKNWRLTWEITKLRIMKIIEDMRVGLVTFGENVAVIANNMWEAFKAAGRTIGNFWKDLFFNIVDLVKNVGKAIVEFIKNPTEGFKGFEIGEIIPKLKFEMDEENVKAFVESTQSRASQVLEGQIDNLTKRLAGKSQEAVDKALEAFRKSKKALLDEELTEEEKAALRPESDEEPVVGEIKRPKKKSKEDTGGFEGLRELRRRIQEAAGGEQARIRHGIDRLGRFSGKTVAQLEKIGRAMLTQAELQKKQLDATKENTDEVKKKEPAPALN